MSFTKILILFFLFIQFSILIYAKFKKKNFFEPYVIFTFINFIIVGPYLISFWINEELFHFNWLEFTEFNDKQIVVQRYILIFLLCNLFVFLGFFLYKFLFQNRSLIFFTENYNDRRLLAGWMISGIIGFSALFYWTVTNGGLSYILSNMAIRSTFTSGQGYVMMFFRFLSFSCIFLFLFSINHKKYIFSNIFFIIYTIIILFFIYTGGGSRGRVLDLIITLFILYYFLVNRFSLVNFWIFLVVIFSFLFILTVPLFRVPGSFDLYKESPELLVEDVFTSSATFFNKMGQVRSCESDLFIFSYFNKNNFWHGKSYLSLLYAPLPSKLFPDKPPIDDGVYIKSLMDGRYVNPPMPFRNLFPSSNPMSIWGGLYANFGYFGLIFGCVLFGMFFQFLYQCMQNSKFSIFSILLYISVFKSLKITSSSIQSFVLGSVMMFVLFFIFLRLRIKLNLKQEKS